MALFEDVFNKAGIYEMLFFNVKTVLEHPTLANLEEKNKKLYDRWSYIAETKYSNEIDGDIEMAMETIYQKNAVYYSEFAKIVAISYATLYVDNGELKRDFKKIVNENERIVIETFFDELRLLSSQATKSNPHFFPSLCGHNIISYDIPTLVKRFVLLNSQSENDKKNQLPLILKRCLNIKPWESGIIDVVNVWKFNGFEHTSLMLISDYLGLKKTVDLLPLNELSQYYWENIDKDSKATLNFMGLQSATQTNLVIQLMNELRQI
jgi:hypothetical protein